MLGEKTRRAVKTPLINLGEKKRKTVRMRPLTLLVCFVCLIGLSVSATYFIDHAKYKKQSGNGDEEILVLQKNNKSLSDKNISLENSLQKLENEHSNLQSQYKDLASELDTAEQRNKQTASELASALKDFEVARVDILKLRDELDSKSSEIEALNVDQQTLEQKYNGFKEMIAPYLILEPTWVSSDQTTLAFDGKLILVIYEASDTSKCYKDSTAVCYLISGTNKEKLCLRTGKPEIFKYQGKKYLFNLLESKESEGAHRYLISILKER
jgi:predicted RNase H-like nuclease (RuvC/YqgF family)